MKIKECIVYGCTNKKHEGNFVGNICVPCYNMITNGESEQPSKNFIHQLYKRIKCYENKSIGSR